MDNSELNIKNLIESGANITLSVSPYDLKKFGEDIVNSIPKEPDKNQDSKNKLLTTEQVCEMLHISRITLYHWDKKAITNPIRLGNLKRYRLTDIEELIKDREGEL